MMQSGAGGNQFYFDLSPHSADGDKRCGLGNVDFADYRGIHFTLILKQNPADFGLFYKSAVPGSAAAGSNSKES